MKLDKKELRYFKHKCYGGKSTAAHLLDCILGSLMLLIFLFFLLRYFGASIQGAAVLSICLCSSVILFHTVYRHYRIERLITAELDRIQKSIALEALTLLPDFSYQEICRNIFTRLYPNEQPISVYHGFYFKEHELFCYAFHNHPKVPVGIRQMMALYRKLQKLKAKNCCLLSTSTYVDDAKAFSDRLGIHFVLLGQQELLSYADIYIDASEQNIRKMLHEDMHKFYHKTKLRYSAFAPNKYRAYLTCAFFLICWYFLFRLSILYPIAALICCILAILSYRNTRKQQFKEESSDSFSIDEK